MYSIELRCFIFFV